MIQRRQFTHLLLAAPIAIAACSVASTTRPTAGKSGFSCLPGIKAGDPLIAPAGRPIKVAFTINPGVQVIDLAGPWETFQDTYVSPEADAAAFEMFTVSDTTTPVRASGGLLMIPQYSIDTAPMPDLVVVPHFDQPSPFTREVSGLHRWIVEAHAQAALTMSICTGAFQLAKTGLLDGIPVTTNYQASNNFAKTFPEMDLRRGPRFVESGRIATSGGLSAGIDLALRVVSRYFSDDVAQQTADRMEYLGTGWRTSAANASDKGRHSSFQNKNCPSAFHPLSDVTDCAART